MFCAKCGKEISERANFCRYCGNKVEHNVLNDSQNMKFVKIKHSCDTRGEKNKYIIIGTMIVISFIILVVVQRFSFKECDWCGNSPSIKYKTTSGTTSYVCMECSKVCSVCGKKATHHYTNLYEMEVFVCMDCFNMISEYD